MTGHACPTCGGFAAREPGGVRCLTGGHMFLYRWILPRDHWLSGRDRANRERQRALDRAFMHPGRGPEFLFEMLDRLAPAGVMSVTVNVAAQQAG